MEEENKGISLRDIFKVIFTQKWLALIIAIVITIAGTLAIQLGYNAGKKYYQAQFSLVLPGETAGNTSLYTYPDGSPFLYSDIVSKTSLNAVKESNEDFAGLDIDKISKNGAVSISRGTADTGEVVYTLKAKASYFPDAEVARQFIIALANIPVNYLETMSVNYDVYVSLSNDADDYESQISLLNSQVDYLVQEYRILIENYGGNFVIDGKALSSYYNEVKAFDDKGNLDTLLANVKSEGILKSTENIAKYRAQKASLDRQLTIAKFTLQSLLSGSVNDQSPAAAEQGVAYIDASVIKAQADLVAELQAQIDDIENYLTLENVDAEYEERYIIPEYNAVNELTQKLAGVVSALYNKASSISFTNSNAVTAEGDIGMIVSVLISLIIGIIVALIVAYIVGYIKQKKAEKPATACAEGGEVRAENVENE